MGKRDVSNDYDNDNGDEVKNGKLFPDIHNYKTLHRD